MVIKDLPSKLQSKIWEMKLPNFTFEEKLARKGYKYIAGVDEVGRGCFAGPVVAGCTIFNNPITQSTNNPMPPINNPIIKFTNALNHSDIYWRIGLLGYWVISPVSSHLWRKEWLREKR